MPGCGGLFTTSIVDIPWTYGKTYTLVPFGDIHYGAPLHCSSEWERFCKAQEGRKDVAFLGMGDYCLPLETEILTRQGWKTYSQLTVGEEVAAYDQEKESIVWTNLRAIYLSPAHKLYRVHSKSFDFTCTENHGWICDISDFGKKKADTHEKTTRKEYPAKISTKDLKTHHRIRVAAQSDCAGNLPITPREAAILGWIVTDGHIRYEKHGGVGNVSIAQSKRKYANTIRELLGADCTGEYLAKTNDCITFNIKRAAIQDIFIRAGFRDKSDLSRIAGNLNRQCRAAMLQAFLEADGWKERNTWCFSQLPGPVLDAFQILAVLSGYRLGATIKRKADEVRTIKLSSGRDHSCVADMDITDTGRQETVWCPTTDFGTCVIRQNGYVTITGNCDLVSTSERAALKMGKGGLHESTMECIEDMYRQTTDGLLNTIKFMKGRCIGLVEGNHFGNFGDGTTTTQRMCQALRTKYLGCICIVRLCFVFNGTSKLTIDILAHHGKGGGQLAGTPFNQVGKMVNIAEADIYLMGHDHSRGCVTDQRIYPYFDSRKKQLVMKERKILYGRTGSFLRGYVPNKVSYIADMALKPANLGWIEIEITPHRVKDGKGGQETVVDIRGLA